MQGKILVVDDEKNMRETLKSILEDEGYAVVVAESGNAALSIAEDAKFDVAITDLKMPGMDGVELLKHFKEVSPEMTVMMITAYGTIESAVEAMKEGAYDYVTKPFNPDEILLTVKKVIELQDVQRENRSLKKQLGARYGLGDIVGKSPEMAKVVQLIKMVAPTFSTVLIRGESGTGKELVAHAIHSLSPRAKEPFLEVNCAALPEGLLESELFGHEKGAFTGAVERKIGKFERASGGTIYLDEIGDMSFSLQAKVLRVLEQREFERVGGSETVKVDVRVVTATNKDLEALIKEGKFREDLYYRLNVIEIKIPPLRERAGDVKLLAEHFLTEYASENRKRIDGISQEAMALMLAHPWSGNVRELENVMERAVILCKGKSILPEDLPQELREGRADKALPKSLRELEREAVQAALDETGGNIIKAAKKLGISRTTLYSKMKKYGLVK